METALRDSVGDYLKEIGRIPMLTPEQEIVLGRKVQKLSSLLSIKEKLKIDILKNKKFSFFVLGLNSSPQSLKKVASQVGLSPQQIRRRQIKALAKLRET